MVKSIRFPWSTKDYLARYEEIRARMRTGMKKAAVKKADHRDAPPPFR